MEFLLPGRKAPIIYESCLESTNRSLKEMARQGAAEGTVLIAGRQTGGRGRLGRRFASPAGGLYLSMLLLPGCTPEESLSITPLAAVAVRRAVKACTEAEPLIKWPNDLLLDGGKLCGILTEQSFDEKGLPRLVLGIGINVNTVGLPAELGAASIIGSTGRETDRAALAARLIGELDGMYALWRGNRGFFLEEYRAHCSTLGRELDIIQNGCRRRGRALGINADFSLKVEYPGGAREDIRFGEVSLREAEKSLDKTGRTR